MGRLKASMAINFEDDLLVVPCQSEGKEALISPAGFLQR